MLVCLHSSSPEGFFTWGCAGPQRRGGCSRAALVARAASVHCITTPPLEPPLMQVLNGMDLYVGAGGLGYLDYVSHMRDPDSGELVPDPEG